AASALAAAGITPVRLGEKEGLALINGTDGMLGMLALAIDDLRMLLTTADVAAAMSVEGLMGTDAVFAEDLHRLRPQRGQAASPSNLRRPRPARPRDFRGRRRARERDRQPGAHARRSRGVERQLPRRPGRLRAR